jgi:hypothetical protein
MSMPWECAAADPLMVFFAQCAPVRIPMVSVVARADSSRFGKPASGICQSQAALASIALISSSDRPK